MLPENTRHYFKVLNDHYSKLIVVEKENFRIAFETSVQLFDHTKNQLPKAFVNNPLLAEDQEELSMYLSWLFNQLFCISINDKNRLCTKENILLQNEIVSSAFKKQRWWFTELITCYTSLLKQSLDWRKGSVIELQTTFMVTPKAILEHTKASRTVHRIVIASESQCANLIHTCITLLTNATPQYCNLKRELGITTRDVVLEVFRQQTLANKSLAVVFLTKYLTLLVEHDTRFFISMMHIMSIVFKDISASPHDSKTIDIFKISIEKFFEEVPIARMDFDHQENLQRLVTHTSEILFHQMSFVGRKFFNPEVLSNVLINVMDEVDFKPDVARELKNLIRFEHQSILVLMKYLIISEMEASPKLNKSIIEVSPSWKSIHDRLTKKIEELQGLSSNNDFSDQLVYISECFLLAVQVEFIAVRRHQFVHGMCSKAPCHCQILPSHEESQEPLMQFQDWNYKHIRLNFFDNLENLTRLLLAALDQHKDIDSKNVLCFIDIFSCILKFAVNSPMVETMKHVSFAVIASPFYKSLKDDQQFGGLAGFRKVMTLLPDKLKNFFDKSVNEEHLRKLQSDSIVQLSQIEISRISNTCWWLIQNIIQYTMKQINKELTTTLLHCFTSFAINNSDKFQSCVDIYQKMLSDAKDPGAAIEPLHNILCLTSGNVLIFKVAAKDNAFPHFIVCDKCLLESTKFPKGSTDNETLRRMGFMKATRALLVSPDRIQQEKKSLQLDIPKLFSQTNKFKIHLIEKIPAMLNHSQDFKTFIELDKGKSFFDGIFVLEEKFLVQLDANLKYIILNILESDFSEGLKKEILDNCFNHITAIAKLTAYGQEKMLQLYTVNLAYTFSITVVNESNMVKCFKVFLLYIVQNNSQIMGEASILAFKMAQTNGVTLHQLMIWHKTFIMRHIVHLAMANYFKFKSSLVSTFVNLTKRLNYSRLRDFAVPTLDAIVASALPMAITSKSKGLMESLKELCLVANQPLPETIVANFMKIYLDIYTNQTPELRQECLILIEEITDNSIRQLLTNNQKKTFEEALVYYNKSPDCVIEVMNIILGHESTNTDPDPDMFLLDEVAEDIKKRFLGVLIYFEPFLTSNFCERVIKKNILLSLGDIIRLLTADRVSVFCFKIITILKAAVEQTSVDLTEISIKIWGILIRNCNISSLAPILSTIFVSLEFFIDKYPEEVNELYKYLVVENNSLLSRNISDLFFIEKTRVDDSIKAIVMRHMESRKLREVGNFKSSLESLCRHMNSENADLKIRVYCLQYLKELFQKNRSELNELICGRMTMDPLIEDILHILVNNCKITSSQMLQLATAECLGELGAIEPSLQQQNYSSRQEMPKTIHCEEFAKIALAQLCRSYQYKNDAKYIDALSLAIQTILQSPEALSNGNVKEDVLLSIPEKMRLLMEPLWKSSYTPKLTEIPVNLVFVPIFWSTAQTALDWAYKWSDVLIHHIQNDNTKYMLQCIRPSMKHNQYMTSLFLPYIVLHNLENIAPTQTSRQLIHEEIQFIFNVLMGEDVFERQNSDRKLTLVKAFDFIPLKLPKCDEKSPEYGINAVAVKVAKLIFEVFDFLENYERSNPRSATASIIRDLLKSFDIEEMAHVNFKCGEYARAMMYLEAKMKEITIPEEFQSKLPFLTNIYAKLDNSDAVLGIQALMTTEWSLEEKVLINNVTGNYHDSAACFERMMQVGDAKLEHIQSIMSSYMSLDQPETALLVYENMIKKLDNAENKLNSAIKAEPLWRLSRFDELEDLLSDTKIQKSTNWGVRCGQLLLTFRADGNLQDELSNTRLAMMKNLKVSGSEQTAYGKNYREIINFHLISEFEKAEAALAEIRTQKSVQEAAKIIENLIVEWNLRTELVQKNVVTEEPIFCFHRIILNETKNKLQKIFPEGQINPLNVLIDGEIGNLWIKSSRLACKNNMYQQAQIYILNAEPYQPKDLFLEKAKLHWIKKDQNNAFKILDLGTKKILGNRIVANLSQEEKEIYSKGKLMTARYNAEAVNLPFTTNKQLFHDAIVKGAENEKIYLIYAEYMDRFYCTADENQTMATIGTPNDMQNVMRAYYRSMKCGSEYVFQSMPRFLSIWFDTSAANCNQSQPSEVLIQINQDVELMVKTLEPYYFYSAFSQLISRLCHPSESVFNVLKKILVSLIKAYPQQSLWFLISMLHSSDTKRVRKCKLVLNDSELADKQNLIREFNSFVEKFVQLATARVEAKAKNITVEAIVPELAHFLKTKKFPIILPFQCNLQLIRVCKQNIFKFADQLVNIRSIQNNVEILNSLQKPRKVVLIGDDGRHYTVLLKSGDDLRIDLRFSEFTNVVKEFLNKDPESRFRQLTTRSYSVIPLTETAGLIEWVPNLRTYKDIIHKEYVKKKYTPPNMAEIAELQMDKLRNDQRILKFRELKQKFYPALGDYFRQQFATPQNYYKARSSFIRTTAAMSIIGYILGLGDRHGENILIDVRSGETFHVDFNMLFKRGENLAVPETVPFRLTHNMIDAMGVLGTEGPFRKNCETILRVLQKEKKTLTSYLRPLIYDPLLKNNKFHTHGKMNDKERVEEEAVKQIKKIELRLKGVVSKYKGSSLIPLSTEGQVNFIIGEATSEANLSAMYRGWMPWL